jgi:hypothetical protein
MIDGEKEGFAAWTKSYSCNKKGENLLSLGCIYGIAE